VIITDDNPRSEEPAGDSFRDPRRRAGAREIGDRRAAIAAAIAEPGLAYRAARRKGHEQGQIVGDAVLRRRRSGRARVAPHDPRCGPLPKSRWRPRHRHGDFAVRGVA